MTEREALKLAMDGFERSVATCFHQYAHQQVMSQPDHFINQTIAAINKVLAQPEQKDALRYRWLRDNNASFTWIPSRYNEKTVSGFSAFGTGYLGFGFEAAVDLAIEAALKEKNK